MIRIFIEHFFSQQHINPENLVYVNWLLWFALGIIFLGLILMLFLIKKHIVQILVIAFIASLILAPTLIPAYICIACLITYLIWINRRIIYTSIRKYYKTHPEITVFAGFFIITWIFYFRAIFNYFQGDEWFYFTLILPLTKYWYGSLLFLYQSVVKAHEISGGAHLTPLASLVYFLNVQLFHLHFIPYQICAIIVHAVNAYLVYRLVKLLLQKQVYAALIAGLFFATSAMHQQAVTWIMTYVWTALAATFLLLSLIFFLMKRHRLSAGMMLCAFLTKETTAILLFLLPLLWFLYRPAKLNKRTLIPYAASLLIYIPYRVGVHLASLYTYTGEGVFTKKEPVDYGLIIFRIITYPLKMIAETFMPADTILEIVKLLTPFAYPGYASEIKTGGSNYLTFSQGPGSDMIVYLISFIVLFAVIAALRNTRYANIQSYKAIIVGLVILIVSAFPLLFIATYAPWWAYVTFFDSRHLYLGSIGAAILFCLVAQHLIANRKNAVRLAGIVLVIVWVSFQFSTLNTIMARANTESGWRKQIISMITRIVPTTIKDKNILITSDLGYYGFGLMPPFPVNFGWILTIIDYDRGALPVQFMKSDTFAKAQLDGSVYLHENGYSFGYFTDKNKFINHVLNDVPVTSAVYAFDWNGKDGSITNTTQAVKDEINKKRAVLQTYAGWKFMKVDTYNYTLKYPQDFQAAISSNLNAAGSTSVLQTITLQGQNVEMMIHLRNKPDGVGLSPIVSFMKNSDGETIGDNFTFLALPMNDGRTDTLVIPTTGAEKKYFLPYKTNDKFFEISVSGSQNNEGEIKKILSTITYY